MADRIDFDFSEFTLLTNDLAEAGPKVSKYAAAAVKVAAHNVKDDWQESARARKVDGSLPAYPAAIDYELVETDDGVGADIGPDPTKNQGTFGIVEEATGSIKSPPRRDHVKALKDNEDDFVRGIAKAGEDALS